MTFSARTELLNEISVGRNGPTSPLVRGVGAVVGSHRKKDGTQMPWNNTFFEASCELKAPTQGVGAWAGATPVWAPLARPTLGSLPPTLSSFLPGKYPRKESNDVFVSSEAN